MIIGMNIRLIRPLIIYESDNLRKNREVLLLMCTIHDYFKQKNIIYDAEITLTNNEYERVKGEFGVYKRRVNYSFQLRYLKKIILYDDYIEFITFNDNSNHHYNVKIGKDFLYFLEWEEEYYN